MQTAWWSSQTFDDGRYTIQLFGAVARGHRHASLRRTPVIEAPQFFRDLIVALERDGAVAGHVGIRQIRAIEFAQRVSVVFSWLDYEESLLCRPFIPPDWLVLQLAPAPYLPAAAARSLLRAQVAAARKLGACGSLLSAAARRNMIGRVREDVPALVGYMRYPPTAQIRRSILAEAGVWVDV